MHLWSNDDIVDGNVDEFHEESNESHDAETDGGGNSDLLEFPSVGLCATFHQTKWVLGKQTSWLSEFDNLIHFSGLGASTGKWKEKKMYKFWCLLELILLLKKNKTQAGLFAKWFFDDYEKVWNFIWNKNTGKHKITFKWTE